MILVIGRCDDVASAERCAGRNKGLQRRDIDLRGDFDELDVGEPQTGVPERCLGLAHHDCVVHDRITWAIVGHGYQPQADPSIANSRRHSHHLRRRERQHSKVRKGQVRTQSDILSKQRSVHCRHVSRQARGMVNGRDSRVCAARRTAALAAPNPS
jgi:hypothetical protein